MDDTDTELVTLLRHNGRMSVTDLAVELKVSRATIRSRMDRLKKDGHILGYTVILRADAVDLPVRGVTMIEIEGRAAEKVVDTLASFPEISQIHTTNGRWDLIVELGAGTLTDLDGVLRRIRHVPGVSGSETSLLLATPRSTRARL
jgi:DNA-binding Lrp family transcriptional regulator